MNFMLRIFLILSFICFGSFYHPSLKHVKRPTNKKCASKHNKNCINLGPSIANHLKDSFFKYMQIPTKIEIDRIRKWSPRQKGNIWELSGQYEGDIILTSATWNEVKGSTFATKWPKGIIPYEIDNNGVYSKNQIKFIRKTLELFEKKTCAKVLPKTSNDTDYVFITAYKGICASEKGKTGGKQNIFLSPPQCVKLKGTILHEFLHVFGFFHQQSSWDRDNYIEINWENIPQNRRHNFIKRNDTEFRNFGVPYDYGSLMHYSSKAMAMNTSIDTILSPEPIGQRTKFSEGDIKKLNRMYGCDPDYCNPNYCRQNPDFCTPSCFEQMKSIEFLTD